MKVWYDQWMFRSNAIGTYHSLRTAETLLDLPCVLFLRDVHRDDGRHSHWMLKLHPVLLDEFENVANRPIRLDSHVGPDLFDILKFSLPIWSVFARSVDSPSHLGIDVITDPLEISLHLILLVQQSIPSTCLLTMSVSEFFLKPISFIRGQLV
jgi:hypothetical protein